MKKLLVILLMLVLSVGVVACGQPSDSISGDTGIVPAEQVQMVDSTGAGDAFFSGTVAARMNGCSLEEAARLGTHLAALTLQTEESTCPCIRNFLSATA